MQWFAQAPANIALIKYMGKKDDTTNTPINSSLSYTLNNLQSSVELKQHSGKKDFWEPLEIPGAKPFTLSQAAQDRFLSHLARIKTYCDYEGSFVVRSSNHFPTGSGLASSASSFAALTKCAFLAISELTNTPLPSIETQAQLSQQASGSSCRSFFSPWALWHDDTVKAIDLPYNQLLHQVILISHEEKKILSSLAHQLIRTSKQYDTRNGLKIISSYCCLPLKRAIGRTPTISAGVNFRIFTNYSRPAQHPFPIVPTKAKRLSKRCKSFGNERVMVLWLRWTQALIFTCFTVPTKQIWNRSSDKNIW